MSAHKLRRFIDRRVTCRYGPRWWKRGTVMMRGDRIVFTDVTFLNGVVIDGRPSEFIHCAIFGDNQ